MVTRDCIHFVSFHFMSRHSSLVRATDTDGALASSSLALTSYASKKWTSIGVASNPLETRAFAPFGVFTGGRNDEDDAIDRARDDEASAPSVSVARTSDE